MNKLLCHCQIIDFALGLGFAYDATAAEYERPTRCFAPSLILDKKNTYFSKRQKIQCHLSNYYVICYSVHLHKVHLSWNTILQRFIKRIKLYMLLRNLFFIYVSVKRVYFLLIAGSIPSSLNRVVNRTACVVPSCRTKYNIQVIKCSDFTAYYLPRPVSCDQAYCFG